MIDKQLFISDSNATLELGNQFADALNKLQEKYGPFTEELDQLADDGDEDLLALLDRFKQLEDLIDL